MKSLRIFHRISHSKNDVSPIQHHRASLFLRQIQPQVLLQGKKGPAGESMVGRILYKLY